MEEESQCIHIQEVKNALLGGYSWEVQNGALYSSIALCSLTVIFGIVGNVMVIWTIAFQIKCSPINVWFLNLAVADLLLALGLPLWLSAPLLGFCPFHDGFCKTFSLVASINLFFTGFLFVGLNVDRWISVSKPFWYKSSRPNHLTAIVCAAMWTLTTAISLPLFFCSRTQGSLTLVCGMPIFPEALGNFTNSVLSLNRTVQKVDEDSIHKISDLEQLDLHGFASGCTNRNDTVELWNQYRDALQHVVLPVLTCTYFVPSAVILIFSFIVAILFPQNRRNFNNTIAINATFVVAKLPLQVTWILLLVSMDNISMLTFMLKNRPLVYSISIVCSGLNPIFYLSRDECWKILRNKLNSIKNSTKKQGEVI